MFLSVRISDCDSDSILESNQKNSKNQSIHLFWLLGEREGSSSDCFHLNDFYFSLQLGILSFKLQKKIYIDCAESRQTLHTSHRITRRFLMKVNILRLLDLNVKLGDTAWIIPAGQWMIFFSWVTDFNFTSCQFWGITLTHCVTSHTKHAIGKWPRRRGGESKINFSLYLVNILDVNSKSNVESWCRF